MAAKMRNWLERGGAFYARKAVPLRLRPVIKKAELLIHLGHDKRTAQRNHHRALAEIIDELDKAELKLQRASGGSPPRPLHPQRVSHEEISRRHYAQELEVDEFDRNRTVDGKSVANGFEPSLFYPGLRRALIKVASGRADDDETAAVVGWALDQQARQGVHIPAHGSQEWRVLARTVASSQLEALDAFEARDRGEETPAPRQSHLAQPATPAHARKTLDDLFDGYIAELKRSGRGDAAERRWRPIIASLKQFLGHNDPRQIKRADLLAWKDQLAITHSAKTVRDTAIGSIKAIFNWALDNDLIDTNPAAAIRVRVPKATRNGEKGFTEQEAKAILAAAWRYQPAASANPRTRESAEIVAAKRWIPILAAYTGARVTEIAQLRKEDVRNEDGIHYIRLTPEAGSIKTGEYRDVPLHAHILELGFLEFVASNPSKTLFYNSTGSSNGRHRARNAGERVGKWIRDLGIVRDDVAPNHGWRHRFKTIALENDLNKRVADAIQGHAPATAGDNYGEETLKAKALAIGKIPKVEFQAITTK